MNAYNLEFYKDFFFILLFPNSKFWLCPYLVPIILEEMVLKYIFTNERTCNGIVFNGKWQLDSSHRAWFFVRVWLGEKQ